MKKIRWHIRDLIDLEYFHRRDEIEEEESGYHPLAKRDREIYLQYVRPIEEKLLNPTHADVIRYWLERRRDIEKPGEKSETVLPGEIFEEIRRLLSYCLLAGGLISGSALTFSLLSYRGSAPVNVSIFLGIFVFLQIFLLLVLLVIFFVGRLKRFPLRSSLVHILITRLITILMENIKRHALKRVGGSKVGGFEAVKGLLKGKSRIYGSLFYWPVFILAQVFGVGFNLGVLGATLLKVLGSDIAFGWQSTVQFSAKAVFDLVQLMALPWSWFLPAGISHPSLSQIHGSHMILKDGVYHLSTTDLVSWWPFLCISVFFYGLLPRAILLMTGLLAQRRRLAKLGFSHVACERLLHRMRTPLIRTEGRREQSGYPPADEVEDKREETFFAALKTGNSLKSKELIVLIPDEIFDDCPEDKLERVLSGYTLRKRIRFGVNEKGDQEVINEVLRMNKEDGLSSLMIIREAWQPPIREDMHFLQDLRKALGKEFLVKVGLIGRPDPDSIFTPVKEEDWEAWKRKLKALGDPYLGLERVIKHDA